LGVIELFTGYQSLKTKNNPITNNTLEMFFNITKLLPKPESPTSQNEKWGFSFLDILKGGQQNLTRSHNWDNSNFTYQRKFTHIQTA
jgi:hypothetical protein